MTPLDDFLRDVICDSVNGESHRFITFTQTDGTTAERCCRCGGEPADIAATLLCLDACHTIPGHVGTEVTACADCGEME